MKNFWSRRDFLFQSGGGMSGLALAYLLEPAGPAWRGRVRRQGVGLQSLRSPAAAFRSARQECNLALHERRRQPSRHVRSEARPREIRRAAADRQRRGRSPPGQSRPAHAQPVSVPQVRAVRHGRFGVVPDDRPARGRDRLPAIRVRKIQRPRAGHLRAEHRQDPDGPPQRRLLGDVRTGLGKPEPSRIRRDLRSPRRTARRTGQLERGIHARGLSGHRLPLRRRSDYRSEAARGGQLRNSSATGSICSPS